MRFGSELVKYIDCLDSYSNFKKNKNDKKLCNHYMAESHYFVRNVITMDGRTDGLVQFFESNGQG